MAIIALITLTLGSIFFMTFATLVSGQSWDVMLHPAKLHLKADQLYDVARSTIAATGLVGAGIAAGLAYRRQRTKELEHAVALARHGLESDNNQRAKESALRERFAIAVDQLGRPESAVRVAGVYTLAQTADDWLAAGSTASAQTCVDVLCAYLRMPHVIGEGGRLDFGEVEVREAVVHTIARRLSTQAHNSWSKLHFDMNGAVFSAGRFLFEGSELVGSFNMTGATVDGDARVIFRDCTFRGGTHFGEVTICKAGFLRFEKVTFAGRGGFRQIVVDGGSFGIVNCHFKPSAATRFNHFTLRSGIARFTNTIFESRVTDFSYARLEGGWLTFHRSKVLGGTLNLDDAQRIADHPVANFNKFEVAEGVTVRGERRLLEERADVPTRMSFEPRYTAQ